MTLVRRTDPLTDRQLEVLRWIADHCPDDVMSGNTHKSSARALESRQLVKISKRNGAWSAVVTDVGSYYLAHESFLSRNHVGYTPRPHRQPVRTKSGDQQRADVDPRQGATIAAGRQAKPRKLSPTEHLVADVVAAGGVLQEPRDARGNGWRGVRDLVRSANRFG
jgi:hypothetical protein